MRELFLFFLLFCFFYFPKFISTTSVLYTQPIIYLIAIFFMIPIIRYKGKVYPDIYKSKKVWKYCMGIILAAFYYMIRYTVSANYFSLTNARIIQNIFPVVVVVNMMVIISLMREWGISKLRGIDILLKMASFQGVISLIALFWEPLKNISNNLYLNYATQFQEGDYILTTRVYGISSDYTYGLPIVHGLLCGISMYLGLKKNKKYITYTMFIFLNVFLNGRTGILVALISIFLAIVFYLNKGIISKRIIWFLIVMPVIFVILFIFIKKYQENIYNFVLILFDEIYNFLFEQKTIGTVDYLFNTNFFLPKGFSFFIGEGHRVYGSEARSWGYIATDVGIVNDMFMGGLVYVCIRYGTMINLLKLLKKNEYNVLITISMVITWIIADIKGQATVNSMIICIFVYIIFCLGFLQDEEE